MQDEINLAAILQNTILPNPKVELPGIDGQALLLTSSEVGGDYYDYYSVEGRHSVLLIGDVAGHGVAAGTLVSAAKARLYPLISDDVISPSEILRSINQTLCATARESMLMTMTCISLDAREGKLILANAGHVLPYLYKQGEKQWMMIEAFGSPLGNSNDFDYSAAQIEIEIAVGDRLFLFTDGVIEAESPEDDPFGYERLERLLQQNSTSEPEVFCANVIEALKQHSGQENFGDDVTVFVVDHTSRVIQTTQADTDASEVLRVTESAYRIHRSPLPRISRQYITFLADGDFADLLPRLSKDGIRRILPSTDAFYRKLGWDLFLSQHQEVVDDDLYCLSPSLSAQRQFILSSSDEKMFLLEETGCWLAELEGLSSDHIDNLTVLLDEMIENSMFGAPRDGRNRACFGKGDIRELAENEEIRIDVGVAEGVLGIMVTDTWGTLTPADFLRHVNYTLENGVEPGVGGAGFYMMWTLSDYLQVRVHPHRRTQVTALWDLSRPCSTELNTGFQFLYHSNINEFIGEHDERVSLH